MWSKSRPCLFYFSLPSPTPSNCYSTSQPLASRPTSRSRNMSRRRNPSGSFARNSLAKLVGIYSCASSSEWTDRQTDSLPRPLPAVSVLHTVAESIPQLTCVVGAHSCLSREGHAHKPRQVWSGRSQITHGRFSQSVLLFGSYLQVLKRLRPWPWKTRPSRKGNGEEGSKKNLEHGSIVCAATFAA
ncbi:hypothetical protein GGS23DRAFT_44590 [Durotheca rogersii]|uniref:uncharacterized protein n=1 Tax=Durotheca rogersii TaxID=419775 RepID=UPI0022205A25|nr:uncharacterized protein GGS23DRAFT_44590 [Durotheca rogersii]KAI5868680.1 hypothetical protein GGS23DRAFT_44590 [Durotheca rogersii]